MRVMKTPLVMTRETIKVMRKIQEDSEAKDYISLMGPRE